jgi:phosphatidylglycerol---prolipoprotein diacylglyceryl transferase
VLPVLFEGTVGGVAVSIAAYPAFLVLAAVAAILLLAATAPGLGLTRWRVGSWAVLALLAGLVGARALSVVLNPDVYVERPWAAVEVSARGFALYGGALAGAVVMVVAARRLRTGFGALADAGVVPFAIGLALVRVGCFLAGCCAGIEADLPWAVAFPSDAPAGGLLGAVLTHPPERVHPTQLYELVAVLVAAGLAGLVARRARLAAGGRAAVFAALFLGFRAADQALRAPSPGAVVPADAITAVYTIIAIGAIAVAVGRLPVRRRMALEAGA